MDNETPTNAEAINDLSFRLQNYHIGSIIAFLVILVGWHFRGRLTKQDIAILLATTLVSFLFFTLVKWISSRRVDRDTT